MEDTIPTVGFNMRKVSRGNVTISKFFACACAWCCVLFLLCPFLLLKKPNRAVGHWRPASLPFHVGALLPRGTCDMLCVLFALVLRVEQVNAIVYVVDSADREQFETAAKVC